MRSQEVIAYVLIIALTISAISLVYAWASPILNKETDKVNVDKCVSYSESIENAISTVAKTGDTVDLQVKIPGFIYFKNNQIIVDCNSNTKLLPSFFVPLSYDQSPLQRENILCNTTGNCGSDCRNGTVNLYGTDFNFSIINGTTICIDSCSKVGGNIIAGNTSYTVAYVSDNYSYILGNYVVVDGLYGKDPLGVVIGKQAGNVELRIVFWPLIDSSGNLHRVHIISNTLSTNGNAVLHISFAHANQTDTYINVNVI